VTAISATEAAFAPGLCPTAMLRATRGLQVDAVIAGAVTDDRTEPGKQVHRLRPQRRTAGRQQRADATELVGRKHVVCGLATGVEQLEPFGKARHHRLGEARIDQDLVSHCSCFR